MTDSAKNLHSCSVTHFVLRC